MSNIFSGPAQIIRNAFFPAAFVTVGSFPSIEKLLPKIHLESANLDAIPGHVGHIATTLFQTLQNNTLSENAKGLLSLPKKFVSVLDPKGFAFDDHQITIGTAAVIGASATAIDMLLKRAPFFKHHPNLRVGFSLSLASVVTFYGAGALEIPVNLQTLKNIAIKVGIVGGGYTAALGVANLGFKALGGSADLLASGVRHFCNAGIGIVNTLNWASAPTTLEQDRLALESELDEKQKSLDALRDKLEKGKQADIAFKPLNGTPKKPVNDTPSDGVRQRTGPAVVKAKGPQAAPKGARKVVQSVVPPKTPQKPIAVVSEEKDPVPSTPPRKGGSSSKPSTPGIPTQHEAEEYFVTDASSIVLGEEGARSTMSTPVKPPAGHGGLEGGDAEEFRTEVGDEVSDLGSNNGGAFEQVHHHMDEVE